MSHVVSDPNSAVDVGRWTLDVSPLLFLASVTLSTLKPPVDCFALFVFACSLVACALGFCLGYALGRRRERRQLCGPVPTLFKHQQPKTDPYYD